MTKVGHSHVVKFESLVWRARKRRQKSDSRAAATDSSICGQNSSRPQLEICATLLDQMGKWTENKLLWGVLMFLGFLSSVPILMETLGNAAWNGVNIPMALYLLIATLGFFGLLTSLVTIRSRKSVFLWIAASSAIAVGGLSLLFLGGFVFSRTPGVPLMDPFIIAGVPMPIIGYYGFAVACCSVLAVASLQKLRSQRAVQNVAF
jgi:hypothetical protein